MCKCAGGKSVVFADINGNRRHTARTCTGSKRKRAGLDSVLFKHCANIAQRFGISENNRFAGSIGEGRIGRNDVALVGKVFARRPCDIHMVPPNEMITLVRLLIDGALIALV